MPFFQKSIKTICLSALLSVISCSMLDLFNTGSSSGGLTEDEVVEGLKAALSVGIDSSSSELSAVGGYYLNQAVKILLPPDVSQVISYAEQVQGELVAIQATLDLLGITAFDLNPIINARDSLMFSMNRAAETAAPLSVPIFKNAITGITITDGFSILNGDSTAATAYLKGKTYDPLVGVYQPFVDSALQQVGAQRLWQQFSGNYNSFASFYRSLPSTVTSLIDTLPFDTLQTNLALYTTQKGLDGLFYMVGQEEKRIRTDPVARVSEILQKVFGSLDH
ncbi:MAG TPA: DUF4197 domain-containing protein [Chitinivibrionales bacterium]|nr:DUF4197 domain-containing protein [Chitinivibrionales bacterium]